MHRIHENCPKLKPKGSATYRTKKVVGEYLALQLSRLAAQGSSTIPAAPATYERTTSKAISSPLLNYIAQNNVTTYLETYIYQNSNNMQKISARKTPIAMNLMKTEDGLAACESCSVSERPMIEERLIHSRTILNQPLHSHYQSRRSRSHREGKISGNISGSENQSKLIQWTKKYLSVSPKRNQNPGRMRI